MNKQTRGLGFYLVLGVLIIGAWWFITNQVTTNNSYTYQDFVKDVDSQNITKVAIHPNNAVPTGQVVLGLKGGEQRQFYVSDVVKVEEYLEGSYIVPTLYDVPGDNVFMSSILPLLLTGGLVIFMIMMMNRQMSGGGSNAKMMNFGKSRAKMSVDAEKKVTFANVAGLQEEKEDLVEIVDFLKNPQKYTKVGARIPKGVLLVGPPGTGKTLLAKAVAGEAGVPFFSISGSDFVEMFVGVGASRVRDLFEEGKKNAPCIIFIDEIDAVARRRGTGMGGGHDERGTDPQPAARGNGRLWGE